MLPKSITTKTLLILAPPLMIGLLVFKNGVDFPVLDEWDGTAPLFEKMADGTPIVRQVPIDESTKETSALKEVAT